MTKVIFTALALLSATINAQQCPAPVVLPEQYEISRSYVYSAENNELQQDEKWYVLSNHRGKQGLISVDGKQIIEPHYDLINGWSDDFAGVLKREKWGFIDSDGKEVIVPQYRTVGDFVDGLAAVSKTQDSPTQLIDKTGKVVLEGDFDYIDSHSEGIVGFVKNDKTGYMNLQGEIIVEPKYELGTAFYQGSALVYQGEKAGVIDKTGKEIIPTKYESLLRSADGYWLFMQQDKYGVLKANGEELFSAKYDDLSSIMEEETEELVPVFTQGMTVASKEGKWGIINEQEQEIVPFKYEYLSLLPNNLLIARQNEMTGVINLQGEEIIPFKFEYIYWYNHMESFLATQKITNEQAIKNDATKYADHVLDISGKEIFYKPDEISVFTDTQLYSVLKDGKYQLFDKSGRPLSERKWDFISYESDGLIKVSENDLEGFINVKGEVVIEPKYTWAMDFEFGRTIVQYQGRHTQVIDKQGCVLIDQPGKWKK